MNFYEAVEAYVRTKPYMLPTPRNPEKTRFEFEGFDVEHEEGWSNDSGTHWPACTWITFDVVSYNRITDRRTGRKHRKELAREHDPVEFMKALFEVSEEEVS